MKKFLAALLCLALLGGITGAVVAGCGSSQAQTYLSEARDALNQAQTFRFKDAQHSTNQTSGDAQPTDQTVAVAGDVQVAGDTVNQHLLFDSNSVVTDYYTVGGQVYINPGDGKWYYDDTGTSAAATNNALGYSKEDIDTTLKAAEGAQISSQDGSLVTITFKVGKVYKEILAQELKNAAERNGASQDALDASLQNLDLLTIQATLVYDKDAKQVRHITRNMELNNSGGSWTDADSMDFYDYGVAIQITLPPETANATPLSTVQQQLLQQQQQTGN